MKIHPQKTPGQVYIGMQLVIIARYSKMYVLDGLNEKFL
jgi:hypothetical protein